MNLTSSLWIVCALEQLWKWPSRKESWSHLKYYVNYFCQLFLDTLPWFLSMNFVDDNILSKCWKMDAPAYCHLQLVGASVHTSQGGYSSPCGYSVCTAGLKERFSLFIKISPYCTILSSHASNCFVPDFNIWYMHSAENLKLKIERREKSYLLPLPFTSFRGICDGFSLISSFIHLNFSKPLVCEKENWMVGR